MRILCLHGYGMNPDVMRHQMSALMKLADPSWEFHFLSGQIECPAAPGVELAFPGPYFCYSSDFDPVSMRATHALVDREINTNGPFDGVFGFSTGAGVLVAYLLERLAAYPDQPLPVKFAVFCSPPPPISTDPVYYDSLIGCLSANDKKRLYSAEDEQLAQLPAPTRSMITVVVKVLDCMAPITRRPRKAFLDRAPMPVPCIIHPAFFKARLPIPTLHVRATKDDPAMKEGAVLIESLCLPELRRTVEHSAIHNLPRKKGEVQELVSAMEWAVAQSQQPQARL
ncbi:uncharacterized protein N7459_002345 [Penicillium hispanicum]|uniref:uncharacterized protein n=1 Tax=Penicillium hispanicum TaxID=1080232 RepID=UPI00253FC270|nr:uncharacterized protein N7459_002345 [Penicillium hispanicum]KAJ5591976.1 hypothetical protein N7459_002345 [Penicillium hispanicum]